MPDNPKTYEVILLDHTQMLHDKDGEYMSVFAIGGQNYKLNAKRQNLWGIFNQSTKGQIILLTFETFTNPKNEVITFLSNAEKGSFEAVWKSGLQSTLKRLLTSVDEDRQRSQALSYAKDIWVAKINTTRIEEAAGGIVFPEILWDENKTIELAKVFFAFIKGQPEPDTEVAHIETPQGNEIETEEGAK